MNGNGSAPQATSTPGAVTPLGGGQLYGTRPTIQGIASVDARSNDAPIVLVVAKEKFGKSHLATTLFGWPTQNHQPLIIAWDKTGPDSCIRSGYSPHAIYPHKMTGANHVQRGRAVLQLLEQNVTAIKQQYGAIVVDCLSTFSYGLLEEARRFSKNPDPRSYYADMQSFGTEFLNRISDLGLPTVWLAWLEEAEIVETSTASGSKNRKVIMGGPNVPGKKWRSWVGGRPHQIILLDKERHGAGAEGADEEGYVRIFHTRPFDNVNVNGRYGHVIPEPCPPSLAYIMAAITGKGFGR